jgi:hypothetical protein
VPELGEAVTTSCYNGEVSVAVDVDQSRALRRPLDLVSLVEAVVAANPDDEGGWIEWKCGLDLLAPAGAFKVVRAILSFANRMPETAARTCGGLAYIVLGAEPGRAPGAAAIDGADLEQAFAKYLGSDGPEWSPHYVRHGEVDVLVILVEAPQWGDPIHTLRKAYDSTGDGTIFVRSQSTSRPANSAEIRLLQERLMRGATGQQELAALEVTATVQDPDAVLVLDLPPETVERWVEERRQAITEWQDRQAQAYLESEGPAFRASVDRDAIEKHLEACVPLLLDAQRRRIFDAEWSRVTVSVLNPTLSILEDVEVTLHLDALLDGGGWSAWDSASTYDMELDDLPKVPPVRHSLSKLMRTGSLGSWANESLIRLPRASYASPDLEITDTSIILSLGQLRPERPRVTSPFSLVLHRRPEADHLVIPWSATSTSTTGIQRGELVLPVTVPERVVLEPSHGIPGK